MVIGQRQNRAAIRDPHIRLALSELALALARDVRGETIISRFEDRLIYYAAMIGTLNDRPPNLSGLALACGLDRKTVRRHVLDLIGQGVLLVLSNRTYVVNADFANGVEAMRRTAYVRGLVENACRAIHNAVAE